MGGKMNWNRVRKEKRHFTNGSVSVQSEGTWGLPPASSLNTKEVAIAVAPRSSKATSIQPRKLIPRRRVEMSSKMKKEKLLELVVCLSEAIEKNDMQMVAKLSSEIYGESFVSRS
jgi:hypothetical protein